MTGAAQRCGIWVASYIAVERGIRGGARASTLVRIGEVLGLDLTEIMGTQELRRLAMYRRQAVADPQPHRPDQWRPWDRRWNRKRGLSAAERELLAEIEGESGAPGPKAPGSVKGT